MGTRADVSTFRVAFRASWSPEALSPVSPEVQYSFKLGFAPVRDWICIRQQLFDWAANWIPPAICSLMGSSILSPFAFLCLIGSPLAWDRLL